MSTVILTEAAAYEVKDMMKNNDMPNGYLKVSVKGGGCTGLSYGMSAEEEPAENDEVLEFYGVKVLVDKNDAPILNGTTIDFKADLRLKTLMLLQLVVAEVHLRQETFQVRQNNAKELICHT